MGKISDALVKHEKDKMLKTDGNVRRVPIKLGDGRTEEKRLSEVRANGGVSEKVVALFTPESAEAENFRLLRSHILYAPNHTEKPRTILVTSAFPREGKTFVTSNLSASIALGTDEKVLVVDTDFLRPDIHRVLGCHNGQGLCQYLDKEKLLNDLVIPTAINKLFVLPAGNVPACPGDSVSSSAMGDFIKEIKRQFADYIIIFDSAPSHITAGSRVIANTVDGILFVIMAQKFPRKEIERSIETLGREKILGVVLNGYTQAQREYHKYYDDYSKSK